MRSLILLSLLLISSVLMSQEITLSQSELDSIADDKPPTKFAVIEEVPIYKGCNKKASNIEKKKCMSQKIGLHFQKHYNYEIPEDSDLEAGMKRIVLTFKVNKEGKVIDANARADNEYLETEAIRVAQLIPDLTPGYQKGKPVTVPYTLPLMVNLKANSNEGITKYPVFRGCDESLSNEELESCSKVKIMNFIKMSYDVEMASRVMPTENSTQFLLEFTITKNGKIKDVNAKANHKAIAIEAIKVAKRLPKFKKPGYWEGVAVDTPFSLLMTIYFQ